jgi:hypothetical protein
MERAKHVELNMTRQVPIELASFTHLQSFSLVINKQNICQNKIQHRKYHNHPNSDHGLGIFMECSIFCSQKKTFRKCQTLGLGP